MNAHDYRFLLSERDTLRLLIGQTSPQNAIGRISLESRLRQVEEGLTAYEGYSPRVTQARLTFQGKPVVDTRGIFVDFGTEAANAFAESVARVGASRRSPLSASGPIPNASEFQLLINGDGHWFIWFSTRRSIPTDGFGRTSDPH